MSDYYNGLAFRAIDSDAASDDEPMSAALEAQLANNHHYLHRVGGGSLVRCAPAEDATQAGDNVFEQASVGLSAILVEPFLVTRGLSEVRLDWHGRLDGYDLDVRLELRGFGVVDATWEQTTGNEPRVITLTLPAPAEYEFETNLILWQIGKAGALDGSPQLGALVGGTVELPGSPGVISTSFAVCILRRQYDSSDTPYLPYEPLLRATGQTLSDGTSGEVAITTSPNSAAPASFVEAELPRLATRSTQITQRHA